MKKLSLFLFISLLTTPIFAQLSERENDPSTYRLGIRPTKGTKVLVFGFNINDTVLSNYNLFRTGDLINGKYFIKDDVAIRAGIRLSKNSIVTKGDIDTSLTNIGFQMEHDAKKSVNSYAIVPGIEKHFSYKNIFDVYGGADLYLGYRRTYERLNKNFSQDVHVYEERKTPETLLGLGGVIGVNVFVLDLPVSLGIEYGLQGIWSFGGKTHVVRETKDPSGVVQTDDYYTQETDALGNPDPFNYSKLKRRSTTINTNNNFRVLLNIYFN